MHHKEKLRHFFAVVKEREGDKSKEKERIESGRDRGLNMCGLSEKSHFSLLCYHIPHLRIYEAAADCRSKIVICTLVGFMCLCKN